jgi:Polysaccharide lyase
VSIGIGLSPTIMGAGAPGGSGIPWQRIRRAQVNSGTTPWDFSSIDLSSAGSTAVRSTSSPPGLIEGASFLTCSCSGVDGQNGRARAMIEPPTWPASRRYLRSSFWLYLPTGFRATIPTNGSMQTWKFDCFPTVNNQVFLLYEQQPDAHKLVVKDANVDSNITASVPISTGVWHRVEIQMKLATTATGWAKLALDGVQVAAGTNVKTIYAADNGSGHKLPYVRFGLSAHGAGQVAATQVHVDDCILDYAP